MTTPTAILTKEQLDHILTRSPSSIDNKMARAVQQVEILYPLKHSIIFAALYGQHDWLRELN